MKKIIKIAGMWTVGVVITIAVAILFLEVLSEYNYTSTIHENAPVKTKRSLLIHAPVGNVWRVFTGVNQWPKWQHDIVEASLQDPFKPGSVIHWTTNGFSIESRLQTVVHNQKIGWAGKAFGSFAVHVWSFEEKGGNTIVTVEESMEGWLVWLMQGYVQSNLHVATEAWLEALKAESERK